MADLAANGTLRLGDYAKDVAPTDILDNVDLSPVLLGLYGEVGGIMSTAKKHVREGPAFPGFRRAAEEEFGDTLWYLTALCRRLSLDIEEVFTAAVRRGNYTNVCVATDMAGGGPAQIAVPAATPPIDATLFALGRSAASLLEGRPTVELVEAFAEAYIQALHAAQLSFSDVARANVRKARGAFIEPDLSQMPAFDESFGEEERLPEEFRVRINQRGTGRSYLKWNGVFIGDPLTDNIGDPDGYRFHDVFHFAHAAILHWSPVMRALIKHKRKSRKEYDEAQDGGRAIVVEEGLTAWIFSCAKELKFFEGESRVSLGILKTIQQFVAGYEVEACPPKLWERAILQGYQVFRQVRDAEGGWVVGNRSDRSIHYEPLDIEK